MTSPRYLPLSLPDSATRAERLAFLRLCKLLAARSAAGSLSLNHTECIAAARLGNLYDRPALAAAAFTVIDLVDQGWSVNTDKFGALFAPPEQRDDRVSEKGRVRMQEHLRRDEQLRRPSVRRFVLGMEQPRMHKGQLLSIFQLMRDGRELAEGLASVADTDSVVRPYVQVVDDSRCELTGFHLHDIWRYFRHTWSNAYSTVPGRSMPILVRDAATPHHAVIGLAAISSPIVQIAERDKWVGWDTEAFLEEIRKKPNIKLARWVARRIDLQVAELHLDDLLRDGVLQPSDLTNPSADVVARLKADAERHRRRHHRSARIHEVRGIAPEDWVARAETDLFRSKRAAALAEALDIRIVLGSYLSSTPAVAKLKAALNDPHARRQLGRVIRKARGERVGTVIADLTVCGAIAPYNALVAGKLVGALAVSPVVLNAYRSKYSRPSEIASAMAGRPITREARLSFVATTSLYGAGSSQYNRLFWPASVLGGTDDARMGFYALGRSRSFGTSHFTDQTVEALLRLAALRDSAIRVNSLFGEGVSPRLRKVRLGLASLGWPTEELLRHGRERILYGVPLVSNLRDYSLGIDRRPEYLMDLELSDSDDRIAQWWLERWALARARKPQVLEAMTEHVLTRPVRHGARVPLPSEDEARVSGPLGIEECG
jgi:hypothetical protein